MLHPKPAGLQHVTLQVDFYEVRWNNFEFYMDCHQAENALLAINVLSRGVSEMNGIKRIQILM